MKNLNITQYPDEEYKYNAVLDEKQKYNAVSG